MLSWMQSSMRQPPGAHCERRTLLLVNNSTCFTQSHKRDEAQIPRWATHLFHPVIIEDVHVIPRSTCKPARKKQKQIHSGCWLSYPLRNHGDAQALPSLEERHVKDRRIGVHELQQEGFQDEALLEVGFSFGNLWKKNRGKMKMQNTESGVSERIRSRKRAERRIWNAFCVFFSWQINS